MIHLTNTVGNMPVAINPRKVAFIKEDPAKNGCWICFDSITVHVTQSYLEVVSLVTNAQ
jgi:hypothetical protein